MHKKQFLPSNKNQKNTGKTGKENHSQPHAIL
jgi:hypothetical protein